MSEPIQGADKSAPEKINLQSFLKGSYRENRVFLNVGCGPKNAPVQFPLFQDTSWKEVRLDIDPDLEPDIVASITDLSMIEDGTADAVHSSHNVEHLFPHEVHQTIKEFHRILKPGGCVYLTMPDLQQVAKRVADNLLEDEAYMSGMGPIMPLDILYGHTPSIANGRHYMAHKTGFTMYTLFQKMSQIGFVGGQVWNDTCYNLYALAYK